MEIVKYPHPALRWVSKPVRQVNDEIRRIATDMAQLMRDAKGIGLAANQVALPIQLFVLNANAESEAADKPRVFINPRIVVRKGIVQEEEGCLSLPGIFGKIKRAERIRVAALDLQGESFELDAEGLESRVIQHEVDHLHGILFTDKMNPLEKIRVIKKIREMEKLFRNSQQAGDMPPNEELAKRLVTMEAAHC